MQRYRVIGGRAVLKNEPGTEFEAELGKAQEQRLLTLGAIEVVEDEPESEEDSEPENVLVELNEEREEGVNV